MWFLNDGLYDLIVWLLILLIFMVKMSTLTSAYVLYAFLIPFSLFSCMIQCIHTFVYLNIFPDCIFPFRKLFLFY